ncbi:MAG: ATP-dependent helicase [Actinomycetota bacterium]|nr:ATP-dependent helicase [Actinomycetota bacterium]
MNRGQGSAQRPAAGDPLGRFSPLVRDWFAAAFAAPTPAQTAAWEAIGGGRHTLVVAPTGSGKTLAAFLSAIDGIVRRPGTDSVTGTAPVTKTRTGRRTTTGGTVDPRRTCKVLYLSPIKALAVDVERNLRSPIAGMAGLAAARGEQPPQISVAVRSGDTPSADRRAFARDGADILITTPESLFLILTSRAREMLSGVETVIVDEVHSIASTKRGAHLAVSLERLDALVDSPAQRIGLSATVRPVEEAARFLAGSRPVSIVAPASSKVIDLDVVVPVEDMTQLGSPTGDLTGAAAGDVRKSSIWPHVEERVVDLITAHRSTIVFANSRRLAERLTARINEVHAERTAGPVGEQSGNVGEPSQVMAQSGRSLGAATALAKAHHGSVSSEQRAIIENELKSGVLPAVVATSSLELGIDMGAVDLVIQVEAPPSVAGGLQRIGRAGHQVGALSHGVMFPKFRGDLLSTAVVAERMLSGQIESLTVPSLPLDVAAQQIVAIVAMDSITVDELHAMLRRSAPFAALSRGPLEAVLDMLSGRYPSEEFAELRPRLSWDRVTGELVGRPGAQRLAVTSGGTIPDRGLFGVFLASGEGPGRRVGELDEEMVYESRVGDVFALGSSSWRIVDITHDRVLVLPAGGLPGRLPFWKGDTLGRPAELGTAHGRFVREVGRDGEAARGRLQRIGLDNNAATNLIGYLAEQQQAAGVLPDETTLVLERFRDELGDWRVVLHSPYGAAVHAPWALVIAARMRERFGVDVSAMHADDGIVLRLPDLEYEGGLPDLAEFITLDPATVQSEVTEQIGGSAVFAARFRECAARALLLPRRQIGQRQPLWQQRLRASQLLEVASKYPSFPIVAEAVRECLQDVFDVPALADLHRRLATRTMRIVEVETSAPSPFASSLLFGYVAQFIYDGDSPLAERRAAALTLDPGLLADLLGGPDAPVLRDLLAADAVVRTEFELQRLADDRKARSIDEIADLLRILGPLTVAEISARSAVDVPGALADLQATRRAVVVRVGGRDCYADPIDAGLLRDGLGVALPIGIAETFMAAPADPIASLIGRYARTRGPFVPAAPARRYGLGVSVVIDALRRLTSAGRLAEGELRPPGADPVDPLDEDATRESTGGREFVDAEVLRLLRRRSLAALRSEVEPVEPTQLARFLPAWNGIGVRSGQDRLRGAEGVLRAVEQLAGAVLPASAVETLVLPARVADYSPAILDGLTGAGEVVWAGHGALAGDDGWISLHLADTAALTLPIPHAEWDGPAHRALLRVLSGGGGYFFRALADAAASELDARPSDAELTEALWDLVFAGLITGDTLAPVRARLSGGKTAHRQRTGPPRPRLSRRAGLSALAAAGRPARVAPVVAGRWSLVPPVEADPTMRAHAAAEILLDRHGIVTRGAVLAEETPGGFGAMYRVLAAFEESGRVRRGYFVEGLGAAQFGAAGAVDRLRATADETALPRRPAGRPIGTDVAPAADALVLAAADPANPFGAALPWPDRGLADTHRPARRAGAVVVLSAGEPILYAERGGRSVLSFTDQPPKLQAAAAALAGVVVSGRIAGMTVTKIDGADAVGPEAAREVVQALQANGFAITPRGFRLRAGVR